jgi:DNA-binding PadR family transcriptional regulator
VKYRVPILRLPIYDEVVPDSTSAETGGQAGSLVTFGRYAGPATLILSSLADGAKHGYALTKDIEQFAGVRLAPGTLYEALSRLEGQGLIEALPSDDRRRPYQLTAAGAEALRAHLADQRRVADVGLSRLAQSWGRA